MSAEIDESTGRKAFAYAGEEPWHRPGVEHKLDPDAPIETWIKTAGLDYQLDTVPVVVGDIPLEGQRLLYRTDINQGLSVVSDRYNIVQPREVLEFFEAWVGGLAKLETAGALFGGRRYWALARIDKEYDIAGDVIHPYLAMWSSCDGSLATTAALTSIRVVCNNTLTVAVKSNQNKAVRLSHSSVYNREEMQVSVETLSASFESYITTAKALASAKIEQTFAEEMIAKILGTMDNDPEKLSRRAQRVLDIYNGDDFIGGDSDAVKGTAYGLLQAATQYIDWESGRPDNVDGRIQSAFWGAGNALKQRLYSELVEQVA